jgi:hypothetical protein
MEKKKIKMRKKIVAMMPSSLLQQNFGETVTKHGFLLWDIDSKTCQEHDIETDYGFYQFRIKSLEDIENDNEKITNL